MLADHSGRGNISVDSREARRDKIRQVAVLRPHRESEVQVQSESSLLGLGGAVGA